MHLPNILALLAPTLALAVANQPNHHHHHQDPSMSPWHHINTHAALPANDATSFTLSTPPKTDIWRPTPDHDVFNAPFTFKVLPKSAFKSLRVTVSGPWKTQFDQGGFAIAFPAADGKNFKQQWVKAGIEFFEGSPEVGVVGTDRFSDWSLTPMLAGAGNQATFEAVRDEESLWIYLIKPDGKRQALRQVTWAFQKDECEGGREVWVGYYAAKPTPEAEGDDTGMEVSFKDWKLESSK